MLTAPVPSPRRASLLLAVALSGAGGLTWEVLWQHHTALALGAERAGTSLAALYAVNTLGAVAGVLGVTFGAIPALGMTATGLCAALLDLGVALWALRRSSIVEVQADDAPPGARVPGRALS